MKVRYLKVRYLYVLLLVIATLPAEFALPSTISYAALGGPNVLEITRGPDRGEQVEVTQAQLVRDIYHKVLSLPEQPTHKVCALYLTAQYQMTFLYSGTSVLRAQVQQGGCSKVILGRGDVRVANASFWLLLAQTHEIGNTLPAAGPVGLIPGDLQSAYALPSATAGKGQTVASVDAYDDPNAEADLAVYRSKFGLPACTTVNHCFTKVDQHGGTHYPTADQNWAGEISLDLDMISAICPNCHILLVEAESDSFKNLGAGVNTAVRLGATEVSNSYSGQETSADATTLLHDYNHPGVTITASSGDTGYGVQLPAAFKTVIAVGGTSLSRALNARGWTESAWGGSGSGCSRYISKPVWQKDSQCHHRAVADVAAVADPDTGVAVYNSYEIYGSNWTADGGTSASAPIIASVYALAGNATQVTGAYLYSHASDLNDISGGSNGTCAISYLCNSLQGYDGLTGLGTPHGIGAF